MLFTNHKKKKSENSESLTLYSNHAAKAEQAAKAAAEARSKAEQEAQRKADEQQRHEQQARLVSHPDTKALYQQRFAVSVLKFGERKRIKNNGRCNVNTASKRL